MLHRKHRKENEKKSLVFLYTPKLLIINRRDFGTHVKHWPSWNFTTPSILMSPLGNNRVCRQEKREHLNTLVA